MKRTARLTARTKEEEKEEIRRYTAQALIDMHFAGIQHLLSGNDLNGWGTAVKVAAIRSTLERVAVLHHALHGEEI